ncbi:probable inactive histone-lysine N-methyltransferase SUVR2 isoform X2 [Ananas comosus]|uniref:Probable inactive histone-lysine N-methyltransferase SUVR2 isoform X2 n=1 Tax=Ananas comosus TaxID=4615 RepID=A0A6P5HBH2_ANACO|nr:probable inactive histone-lysine N-methyltransferase SUVR2 isoform X2 [Ananas comosus]
MVSNTERARAALNAMKALGFPKKVATPVLKNLLMLYGGKWELIEDENYRALADAVLDMQEKGLKDTTGKQKDTAVDDEPESHRGTLRIREDDQVASPSAFADETPLKRPKLEVDEVPESQTGQDKDSKKKDTAVDDEPELYRTRAKIREEDEQASPSQHTPRAFDESMLGTSTSEANELPKVHIQQKETELNSSRKNSKGKTLEAPPSEPFREQATGSISRQHVSRTDGRKETQNEVSRRETRASSRARQSGALQAQSSSLVVYQKENSSANGTLETAVCLKEPKVEPGTMNLQKNDAVVQHSALAGPIDEPLENNSSKLESPLAVLCPVEERVVQGQGSEDGSLRSIPTLLTNVTENDSKQHEDRAHVEEYIIAQSKNGARDGIVNVQETSSSIDIASSAAGEVKLSLTCNTDSSNFHMPSLDTIYKMVEDRCLRSYKFLPPNFSLRHLMNEICECVLDLGTEPSSINHGSYVKINPTIESLKRPGLQNVNLHPSSGLPNVAVPNNGAYLNENACGNDKTGRAKKAMQSAVGGVSNNMPECSMALWQSNLALCDVRPTHDINDISKGEERVRISVVNEISSEKYPPSFSYIPQNVVFQNAHVDFALARIGDEDYCSDCFGDCLSAPVSCPCARETGGEYAYTYDGLVKKQFLDECISMNRNPEKHHHFYCKDCPLERPKNEANKRGACKGHLVRRFVKECWSKCGCNKQCGNRVVQRGITWNLQVFFTADGKGWGLRTLDELPRGAFVCEYVGEVLTNIELYERTVQNTDNARHTYPVLLDADWGSESVLRDEEALCLDATFYGNVARFINHRCYDANLVEIPVEIESPDHHYYHLAFFTTRKIEAFEELTWDYGIDFDDHEHPVKAFRCRCRSRLCRDQKRSKSKRKASASK